jgi:hypothetical protein
MRIENPRVCRLPTQMAKWSWTDKRRPKHEPKIRVELNWWSAHLRHPDPLILPTLAADAAAHIRRRGAVLEVAVAGCRQGGLQIGRPLLVGLGESPDLVRGEAKLTEHRAERLATVDRIKKLLPHLDW